MSVSIEDFIQELRTTDKPQIIERQYNGEGFCAAGLLRNLVRPSWKKKIMHGEQYWYWDADESYIENAISLIMWTARHDLSLITMNDSENQTFKEIAERLYVARKEELCDTTPG